jgi:hypothetical protein
MRSSPVTVVAGVLPAAVVAGALEGVDGDDLVPEHADTSSAVTASR